MMTVPSLHSSTSNSQLLLGYSILKRDLLEVPKIDIRLLIPVTLERSEG
jgi:hypothetical protein